MWSLGVEAAAVSTRRAEATAMQAVHATKRTVPLTAVGQRSPPRLREYVGSTARLSYQRDAPEFAGARNTWPLSSTLGEATVACRRQTSFHARSLPIGIFARAERRLDTGPHGLAFRRDPKPGERRRREPARRPRAIPS